MSASQERSKTAYPPPARLIDAPIYSLSRTDCPMGACCRSAVTGDRTKIPRRCRTPEGARRRSTGITTGPSAQYRLIVTPTLIDRFVNMDIKKNSTRWASAASHPKPSDARKSKTKRPPQETFWTSHASITAQPFRLCRRGEPTHHLSVLVFLRDRLGCGPCH